MKTTKTLEPGLVFHGKTQCKTLAEHLLPILATVDPMKANQIKTNAERLGDGCDYCYTVELIFDELNNHCPKGYYFGASQADNAQYGCWPWSEEQQRQQNEFIDRNFKLYTS